VSSIKNANGIDNVFEIVIMTLSACY